MSNDSITYNEFLDKIKEHIGLSENNNETIVVEVSQACMDRKEELFKKLKKRKQEFIDRYGEDDAESVMHGTAMNMAKKELGEQDEYIGFETEEELVEALADELKKSVKSRKNMEIKLEDGEEVFIKPESAKEILKKSSVGSMVKAGKNIESFMKYLEKINVDNG